MHQLEEIKLFLPKYLSAENTNILLTELNKCPYNMDARIYIAATELTDKILQGDGIDRVPVINLPDNAIREAAAMVVSNSCDNDPSNARLFASRLSYCPILRLNKYKERLLEEGREPRAVEDHISDIRKQKIAQIFYLPVGSGMDEERFIFFNNLISCDADHIYRSYGNNNRLFRLSDYGIYIFIFKLSVYFTRITEGIERK